MCSSNLIKSIKFFKKIIENKKIKKVIIKIVLIKI